MRIFDYQLAPKKLMTPEIVALLTAIHEYKGRQGVLLSAHSDVLDALVEVAKVQSTGASNRIEGISTSNKRLQELVENKATPRNRNEREIAGYREALGLIHESHDHIELRPNVILQLHRVLYSFSGEGVGGAWKNTDNVISETDARGKMFVRFRPTSALQTPDTIEQLCVDFSKAWKSNVCDRLVLSLMFILDFLCIHPFTDGNGRMSRLLNLLLFYRAGHRAGKYISMEKLIEESKATYYEVLQDSSLNWHEHQNDYGPFVHFGLGILLKACRELDTRIELIAGEIASKPQRIKAWIDNRLGSFSKRDILEACPDISRITVERTLAALAKAREIVKQGAGPATEYVRTSRTP